MSKCYEQLGNVRKVIALLERDEEIAEKVFKSSQLEDRIRDAVGNYRANWEELAQQSQPLVKKTNLYKTLSE